MPGISTVHTILLNEWLQGLSKPLLIKYNSILKKKKEKHGYVWGDYIFTSFKYLILKKALSSWGQGWGVRWVWVSPKGLSTQWGLSLLLGDISELHNQANVRLSPSSPSEDTCSDGQLLPFHTGLLSRFTTEWMSFQAHVRICQAGWWNAAVNETQLGGVCMC